jgi:hypothetical protein
MIRFDAVILMKVKVKMVVYIMNLVFDSMKLSLHFCVFILPKKFSQIPLNNGKFLPSFGSSVTRVHNILVQGNLMFFVMSTWLPVEAHNSHIIKMQRQTHLNDNAPIQARKWGSTPIRI